MPMTEKQIKTLTKSLFAVVTVIVLAMFLYSLLHLNRYWICAKPQYRASALCVYDFPME